MLVAVLFSSSREHLVPPPAADGNAWVERADPVQGMCASGWIKCQKVNRDADRVASLTNARFAKPLIGVAEPVVSNRFRMHGKMRRPGSLTLFHMVMHCPMTEIGPRLRQDLLGGNTLLRRENLLGGRTTCGGRTFGGRTSSMRKDHFWWWSL